MKSRSFLLGVTLVLLFAIGAWSGCGRRGSQAQEAAPAAEQATPVFVVTARSGPIDVVEHLTGTVEAWQEVDVQTEISGKIAWVGPQVGDRVTRGQPIVKLDTALAAAGTQQAVAAAGVAQARFGQSRVGLKLTREQTEIQLRQAEKNLEQARNRLRQAKVAADLTRTRVEDAIKQAQNAVAQARSRLADIKAGARTQELAQAQARVDQAKAAERLAKTNLERMQKLVQGGAVAQAQLDAAQTEYETAVANLRVAEQALDLAKEGARTEQVRLAELQVAQAEQALALAEAQRSQIEVAERDVRAAEVAVAQAEEGVRLAQAQKAQVAATEQEVQAAQASVRQAQAAVQSSRTQLRKHVVYAPIAGEVAGRYVEPGEGALPGVPLIRIVDLSAVRINCEASELQVARLRVGLQADVRVDALPGRKFVGVITDIAPQSRKDQRIYIVRVRVPNGARLLKAGMFARVDIVVARHPQAVLIPRDALVEQGARRVVYAVEADRVKVREVLVGASTDSAVEIVRGVRPGEVLVFGGQSLLADGERVKPTPRENAGAAASASRAGGSLPSR